MMNSRIQLFASSIVFWFLPASLHAAIILRIEDTLLLANTPNQVVRILGTYDATQPPIDGVSLGVIIGLGGPDAALGPLPGNVDGPNITSINLKPTGGILSTFTSNQEISTPRDQFIQGQLLRASSNAPISSLFTNQLIAELIVNTTGVALGNYQADLQNGTLGFSSSFLGDLGGTIPTTQTSGTLTVTAVPEPGSLLILSLACMCAVRYLRPGRSLHQTITDRVNLTVR